MERLELHFAKAAWNRSSNWERRAPGEMENCLSQGLPGAPLTLAEAERERETAAKRKARPAAEKLEIMRGLVLE